MRPCSSRMSTGSSISIFAALRTFAEIRMAALLPHFLTMARMDSLTYLQCRYYASWRLVGNLGPDPWLRLDRSGARNASGGARRNLAFDAAANFSIRDIEVVAGLEIDPELRRSAEIPGQARCRVRRNPAAAKHNVIDARARHPDRLRERVNADLHRFQEIVAQNFARMNERQPLAGDDIAKVDPARIPVLALDAHGFIPCGSPRSRHSIRRLRAPSTGSGQAFEANPAISRRSAAAGSLSGVRRRAGAAACRPAAEPR